MSAFIGLLVLLLLVNATALAINKRLLDKINAKRAEDDCIIALQRRELEKQNKLVGNITNLYNDVIEYDRMKTEFFSNISHDLKTPLSIILGAVQLIDSRKSGIPFDHRKLSRHLGLVKQNVYRLIRLVNNILDITRMDSGFIKVHAMNCNIVYLVEEITQSIAIFAEQKGLTLEFDTDHEEIITSVDVDKVERIILNLLSNAIKFTPAGGKICVSISSRNDRVFISVKDTGLGIPQGMQETIFERFKQVNTSLTRQREGSGIGLALVKSFVELLNGNVSVKSEENKGSEFIIELPVVLGEVCIDGLRSGYDKQNRIIEAINIEFSDIYSIAS